MFFSNSLEITLTHSYPSDINREQFDKIKPILESARKKTRPRSIDLYDVFCGVLYVLKSGCQWRMLPKEFPKWRTCHYYFIPKQTEELGFRRSQSLGIQAIERGSILQYRPSFDR